MTTEPKPPFATRAEFDQALKGAIDASQFYIMRERIPLPLTPMLSPLPTTLPAPDRSEFVTRWACAAPVGVPVPAARYTPPADLARFVEQLAVTGDADAEALTDAFLTAQCKEK